jgi:hypothetical protein
MKSNQEGYLKPISIFKHKNKWTDFYSFKSIETVCDFSSVENSNCLHTFPRSSPWETLH